MVEEAFEFELVVALEEVVVGVEGALVEVHEVVTLLELVGVVVAELEVVDVVDVVDVVVDNDKHALS